MNAKLKYILLYSLGGLILIVVIGFRAKKLSEKKVAEINIDISHPGGIYLIDQNEVKSLLLADQSSQVQGLNIGSLNFRDLEERVETNAFVSNADIYFDVAGNLVANVSQAKPIARILNPNGQDHYIDISGRLLPLNSHYTPRVALVTFDQYPAWKSGLWEDEFGSQLLDLLIFIDKNHFWKAQIAQVMVDTRHELTLMPQVTKQMILFGQSTEIESKFKKLEVFYREVGPKKGWNTYNYVNLKYTNQIVCK